MGKINGNKTINGFVYWRNSNTSIQMNFLLYCTISGESSLKNRLCIVLLCRGKFNTFSWKVKNHIYINALKTPAYVLHTLISVSWVAFDICNAKLLIPKEVEIDDFSNFYCQNLVWDWYDNRSDDFVSNK